MEIMERPWKVWGLCLGLLFCELCNGLPINLENTAADPQTQLLTGLVAVLLTVCGVVLLAGCLCCQRRSGFKADEKKEFRDSPVVASAASNLDHGLVNPVANGEFTIFTPLSPPHQNNNVFLANQQLITRTQEDYGYGDVDVSSWFDGSDADFPRIKLKYIKEIGKGWFGRVVEGAAQDVTADQKWTPVMVRILEATASSRERVVFLHDASIYKCGPQHPNILKLIGRCLDTIPLLLLQELCPQGDLKKYLRENKATADQLLSSEYPLVWCCQLTSALKHLHDHKLTHPDLAARNCQLAANLTLKLGDYGLAVFQYPDDYYRGAPGVPVRWCAPESLSYTSTTIQPNKVTAAANIWSLAVSLWEICECGEQPYADLTDDEVISQVLGSQNVRLDRPKCHVLYTDYMFKLMQLCWTTSESRPAVSQIDLMLSDLLQVYKNTNKIEPSSSSSVTVEDFDRRWASLKPNCIVKTDNHVELIDTDEEVMSKPLSPSLNNLHGSLDNLEANPENPEMESWLESVAQSSDDMSYVRGLSDAIKDLDNTLALENTSSSDSTSPSVSNKSKHKLEFKLGPLVDDVVSIQRASSGSETEEENWKNKIERGAYSEKVRQKSRSVADLMILTHIDQSESDTETTPLPSLDYRVNYKNVRYAPRQNLENVSLTFGSEGNLLSVKDTFQDELKKLQDERRDSLLFVPEKRSQSVNVSDRVNANLLPMSNVKVANFMEDSPSKRLMEELNSPSEIKPANQVYNVFNVTIDKFSPVHMNKLEEIINGEEVCRVPKLVDIIQSNRKLMEFLNNPLKDGYFRTDSLDNESQQGDAEVLYDSGVEGDKNDGSEVNLIEDKDEIMVTPGEELETYQHIKLPEIVANINTNETYFNVPKLVDLIQDDDELMDYIIARYETQTLESEVNYRCEVEKTKEFLAGEKKSYDDFRLKTDDVKVDFDLSCDQDEAMPNSLTHSTVFASSPFAKKSLPEITLQRPSEEFTSLDLFRNDKTSDGLYSLETWDNFLGKTLDTQNRNESQSQENAFFDSFSSEPQSMLFLNDDEKLDATYVCEDKKDATFNVESGEEDLENANEEGTWESSGGWFLHPQSTSEDISGEITVSASASTDSYVGFNMDDEVMAAIRNELLNKLPQAQGGSGGNVHENEEWDGVERNELFLRYNVYSNGLSPIPEESLIDEDSVESTPRHEESDDGEEGSDWSDDHVEPDLLPHESHDTESHSALGESPIRGPLHRHTPSQDSCCSNDTLFNLEELTCAGNDADKDQPSSSNKDESRVDRPDSLSLPELVIHLDLDENKPEADESTLKCDPSSDKSYINEFLAQERKSADFEDFSSDNLLPFAGKQVAPLPSPEDKPWKELAESLLTVRTKLMPGEDDEGEEYDNVAPESLADITDIYNEADYVNIVNLENTKNSAEFERNSEGHVTPDYVNFDHRLIMDDDDDDGDNREAFGVLADIRFSGPGDSQMMTTSFSESNDLNDEQDWDSGSDTRSSSSGEFIWKEGEHEESLKALRAAPQDVLEDIKPMEGIMEETSSEEESTSGSDEEGESPDFVPSAWDKHATPMKSALRSPEKTLEKQKSDAEKKSRGVWFKKQKYHCVYEYPREPESPILHSYDLWQTQPDYSSFADWDLEDGDFNGPITSTSDLDEDFPQNNQYQPNKSTQNLYQLSGIDDEFFISSSAKPFDKIAGLSCQFFPGNWPSLVKTADNCTPDSGVEDITTPAGLGDDFDNTPRSKDVKSLKDLASAVLDKSKKCAIKEKHVLGGLRHTRNKLKLDLPPSPSAFTSSKVFNVEPPVLDPVVSREKPTFTTFGKSRFLVQHVDTPPDEASEHKNVSFEALPYKPLQTALIKDLNDSGKGKVEMVRGEASLLDSADEDSGIESSTLERNKLHTVE